MYQGPSIVVAIEMFIRPSLGDLKAMHRVRTLVVVEIPSSDLVLGVKCHVELQCFTKIITEQRRSF